MSEPTPRSSVGTLSRRLGPLIGLAFAWGLFALLAGGDFTAWPNQRLMLLQTAVVGTAAVGATLVIISGGIDLSVGSTIALGTVVCALLLRAGWPPTLAALATIVTSAAVGAGIGALVVGHVARLAAVAAGVAFAFTMRSRLATSSLFSSRSCSRSPGSIPASNKLVASASNCAT